MNTNLGCFPWQLRELSFSPGLFSRTVLLESASTLDPSGSHQIFKFGAVSDDNLSSRLFSMFLLLQLDHIDLYVKLQETLSSSHIYIMIELSGLDIIVLVYLPLQSFK